jgi:hypothetical protein
MSDNGWRMALVQPQWLCVFSDWKWFHCEWRRREKSYRVLTMVYNTQDYWVFGLRPSSGILKNTKEHNVSETGSVSVLMWEVGDTLLGPGKNRFHNVKTSKLILCIDFHGFGLLAKSVSQNFHLFFLSADCLENVGASTSHHPIGIHGPVQGQLYPFFNLFYYLITKVIVEDLMTERCIMWISWNRSWCHAVTSYCNVIHTVLIICKAVLNEHLSILGRSKKQNMLIILRRT